jgi:hypothetical protein
MSRLPASVRASWRAIAVACVGALLLAGCTNSVAMVWVTGMPSIGISVPLHTVACTTTGSCVALGTTGSDLAPSSVGEYRENDGTWSSLVVPSAPSSVITTASCWSTGCLIGGVQPSGNLLWGYNASSQSISVLRAPAGGQGVRALSCFGVAACAVIVSTGVNSSSLLSYTDNGGAAWSTKVPLDWSLGETMGDLACTDPLDCMATAVTSSNTLDVEVTHDAGLTWTVRSTPSAWLTLSSLSCRALRCVGLATTSAKSLIVRTSTFGRRWSAIALPAKANAIACSTYRHCVVAGERNSDSPWLATLDNGVLHVAVLKYVPTPLVDVACGAKVCATVGVTTVLALRP